MTETEKEIRLLEMAVDLAKSSGIENTDLVLRSIATNENKDTSEDTFSLITKYYYTHLKSLAFPAN